MKEGEQLGKRREEEVDGQDGKNRLEKPKQAFVVLPYMKGVTERLQRAYEKDNSQLVCKAGYPIRNAVVCPNDPLDMEGKCGVIYECKSEECGQFMWGKCRDPYVTGCWSMTSL